MKAPELSIVIATYNRAASLRRTLESLAAQDLDPARWEAVVVDNNSADHTSEVFGDFSETHPDLQLTLVSEARQGLSPARNRGIAESRGGIVAIIDDDETVNAAFARSYLDFFDAHPDVAAAGGIVTPLYESAPPRWLSPWAARPITGALNLGHKAKPFPRKKYPPGGNMAVRRAAFDRYGLFDPALGRTGDTPMGGEEKELAARLRAGGEALWYVPGAEIFHYIPADKLTSAYFDRVNRMNGASERLRTRAAGGGAFFRKLVMEGVKWAGAILLCLGYTLTLRPAKGWFLLRMRWQISRGLVGD